MMALLESRLASYLAIAKGDVEAMHWFRLGRHATVTEGQFALLFGVERCLNTDATLVSTPV